MNIGVSEWKALKQETKLKLLRNAALASKNKYTKIKPFIYKVNKGF
jgi:hypothetical protein